MRGTNRAIRRAAGRRAAGRRAAGRRASGFTLLEMMLVVVIIGVLATVVVVNITGQGDDAKRGVTVTKISQVHSSLQQYYTKNNVYPVSLDSLVTSGLLTKVPADGWDRAIVYYTPAQEAGKPYTLYSLGADNQAGTTDDINVWTMDEKPVLGGN